MHAMHSAIDRMLKASARLPQDLNALFSDLFMHRKTPEQICQERQLSMDEFLARRAQLLRTLRAAAA